MVKALDEGIELRPATEADAKNTLEEMNRILTSNGKERVAKLSIFLYLIYLNFNCF